jgi:hypothetical protein
MQRGHALLACPPQEAKGFKVTASANERIAHLGTSEASEVTIGAPKLFHTVVTAKSHDTTIVYLSAADSPFS